MDILIGMIIGAAIIAIIYWLTWPREMIVVTNQSDSIAGGDIVGRDKCWCATCHPNTLDDMRFIVCPTCGNKRCPRATNHIHDCTNSNAFGQKGSAWETFPLKR